MRALALGADAAFAGKSFLWALGALGDDGPDQLIDLYIDELRASLGQIGAHSPAEAREATIRIRARSLSQPRTPHMRTRSSGTQAANAQSRPAAGRPV